VEPLIRVFVEAAPRMVGKRRLLLFKVLLDSLSPSDHLHGTVGLLLAKGLEEAEVHRQRILQRKKRKRSKKKKRRRKQQEMDSDDDDDEEEEEEDSEDSEEDGGSARKPSTTLNSTKIGSDFPSHNPITTQTPKSRRGRGALLH
jgi:hypothetical protein